MTTWYSGNGWGWCSIAANSPAMALLWVAAFTAIVLAVRFSKQTNRAIRVASTAADSIRAEDVLRRQRHAQRGADQTDNQFLGRLM